MAHENAKISARKYPLGLPLSLAAVGTLVTMFGSRKLHVAFGAIWTLLSLWHGYQHRKKMQKDVARFWGEGESLSLKNFLAGVKIASFTEGRLRIYHAALVGNEPLIKQIEEYVASFTGVKSAEGNSLTGSFLIVYDAKKLRAKKGLARLETTIAKIAKI